MPAIVPSPSIAPSPGRPGRPSGPSGPGSIAHLRVWTGAGLSILAHTALLLVIGVKGAALPPSLQERSPLRFTGQTFNIDSLGSEEEALLQSEGAPAPPAPLEESPARPKQDEKPKTPPKEKAEQEPKPKTEPRLKLPSTQPTEHSPEATPPVPLAQKPAGGAPLQGGAYGESGPPAGTMDLFRAFLKTLPLAAKSDPRWAKLEPGPAGTILVRLTLDESSKLMPVEILKNTSTPPPEYLKRMVTLNRNFLLRGRFAIGPQSSVGSQVLKLTATISTKAPDPETPEAKGVRAFGLRGGSTPTGAYFTYFSGRHIELRLERE